MSPLPISHVPVGHTVQISVTASLRGVKKVYDQLHTLLMTVTAGRGRNEPTEKSSPGVLASLLGVTVIASMAFVVQTSTATAATTPGPVAVTPYSGFNALLTRAPYVTDLTQTSADVTWATTMRRGRIPPVGTTRELHRLSSPCPGQAPRFLPAQGHQTASPAHSSKSSPRSTSTSPRWC